MFAPLVPTRHAAAESDSDSDYGARSKKKKPKRISDSEIRVSSRGGRVPNYVDDVQDFEKFEDEDGEATYYVDPNVQFKEEDEIEAVLSHSRDEGREADPDDLWFDNIVCSVFLYCTVAASLSVSSVSAFISSGRTFPIFTTRTRRTSS